MNERIKQLAKQANIHFSRVGVLDGDPNGSARMVGYSKLEKFAEAIIRECMDTVLGFHNQFGDSAHNEIKQHFKAEQ